MPIRYRCPNCQKLLRAGSRSAGRSVACPACGDTHTVPETTTDAEETTPPLADSPAQQGGKSSGQVQDCESYFQIPASTAASKSEPEEPIEPQRAEFVERPFDDDDEDEDDVGFAPQSRERHSDDLDLIPMVDCVFLLLVFYMITATYGTQKTISVAPPDPAKQGMVQIAPEDVEAPRDTIVVRIDEQNLVYVDDILLPDRQTLTDTLTTRRAGNTDTELVVEADSNALHESLVAVVDAAQALHFERIRVAPIGGSDRGF